ncbi:MAG: hypothetical protein K9K84_07860 [Methylovulum sp.]|nr:hypothetical protein [Methylovulum sp.]
MPTQRLLFFCALPVLITGCTVFNTKEPAPVYQSRPTVYRAPINPQPAAPTPPKTVESSTTTIEITALPETNLATPIELPSEPLTPEQNALPSSAEPVQDTNTAPQTSAPLPETTDNSAPSPPQVTPTPPMAIVPPSALAITPPQPDFEPLSSFAPLSAAVNALVLAANQNTEHGNLQNATATIERAIRIEPRNATLYYKLALLRLQEARPRLAEDLAKKSAILASNDTRLKKHSWLLIARARELQNNLEGAKAAKAKANDF